MPGQRPPTRLGTGHATPYHPVNSEDHYRVQYVQMINLTSTDLKARYYENRISLSQYCFPESMLIK